MLFVGGLLLFLNYGGLDREATELGEKTVYDIELILIKNGYCSSFQDCTNKHILPYDGLFNTLYYDVYYNVDKNTRDEICTIVKELNKKHQNVGFVIKFYDYNPIFDRVQKNKKAFDKCKY